MKLVIGWRPRARAIFLLAVLSWTGTFFCFETAATIKRHFHTTLNLRQPSRWLPRTRQVLLLTEFLQEVDARAPRTEKKIAFSAPGPPLSDGLYQYLWASYLLPERDLVPAGDLAKTDVRFLAAYKSAVDTQQLEVVARFKNGILYRISR